MLCFVFRGFPVWLKYVPGIAFRTDNEPFKVGFGASIIIMFLFIICDYRNL